MSGAPLLSVRGLVKHFDVRRGAFASTSGTVHAVDGIDLDVRRGETLALVGESGSGKTTAARCILRLAEPTAGKIVFDGTDLLSLGRGDLRRMRRRLQAVFQDPDASLNPRMRVGRLVGEPLTVHGIAGGEERHRRVGELLESVGLDAADAGRFPHEFSGGQKQRIGIARALASSPDLIVCDEPVSALDVSVRAQIVNLLAKLQRDSGIAYLFIAHDLSLVRHVADRIAVMYLGRIVESGPADEVVARPRHPYTEALLASAPVPDPDRQPVGAPLAGEIGSSLRPPAGCRFHPRCPVAEERCERTDPPFEEVGPAHVSACLLAHR